MPKRIFVKQNNWHINLPFILVPTALRGRQQHCISQALHGRDVVPDGARGEFHDQDHGQDDRHVGSGHQGW